MTPPRSAIDRLTAAYPPQAVGAVADPHAISQRLAIEQAEDRRDRERAAAILAIAIARVAPLLPK